MSTETIETKFWDDSAWEAVNIIAAKDHPSRAGSLEQLRRIEDWLISEHFGHEHRDEETKMKVENLWASMGAEAFILSEKLGKKLFKSEVVTTLIKKQRDYGPDNIARFGRQGLIVRMHDKIARLENLTSRNAAPNNESIADNVLDVIGYAAIGIMWENDKFLLPMKPYAV